MMNIHYEQDLLSGGFPEKTMRAGVDLTLTYEPGGEKKVLEALESAVQAVHASLKGETFS